MFLKQWILLEYTAHIIDKMVDYLNNLFLISFCLLLYLLDIDKELDVGKEVVECWLEKNAVSYIFHGEEHEWDLIISGGRLRVDSGGFNWLVKANHLLLERCNNGFDVFLHFSLGLLVFSYSLFRLVWFYDWVYLLVVTGWYIV